MVNSLIVVMILLTPSWAGKPEEVKKEVVPVFSTTPGKAIRISPSSRGAKQPEDTLFYYNMVDYNAIGLTQGGTFEAAIRLTPTELSPYSNWKLVKVRFYHHEAVSHSGQIRFMPRGPLLNQELLLPQNPIQRRALAGSLSPSQILLL
jgi:hypothetical protein